MVALVAGDIQSLIIQEVGDTPDELLVRSIQLIWASYADKAAIFPRLQELYTKRRCIDLILATLRNQVTFSVDAGVNVRLGDRTVYLRDRRAETCDEIAKWERIAAAIRPAVLAPLTHTVIEPPPTQPPPATVVPDANAEWFRGSPYYSPADTGVRDG